MHANRASDEHNAEGGAERWLVTYADMLTLLLVLFIVLFSISVVNTSKFDSLRGSLATAFGSGPKSVLDGGTSLNDDGADAEGVQFINPGEQITPAPSPSNIPSTTPKTATPPATPDYSGAVQKEINNFKHVERIVGAALAKHHERHLVQFTIDRRGLVITIITNGLVFPGNSAQLELAGQRILDAVTPALTKIPNRIEVDGYTNQLAVSTGPNYPTGWELSSARASAVVRYLIAGGIGKNRLSAVGYSDQHPLYPASNPLSVTRNRRVEVVVQADLPDPALDQLEQAGSSE